MSAVGMLSTTNQPRSSKVSAAWLRPAPDKPVMMRKSAIAAHHCRVIRTARRNNNRGMVAASAYSSARARKPGGGAGSSIRVTTRPAAGGCDPGDLALAAADVEDVFGSLEMFGGHREDLLGVLRIDAAGEARLPPGRILLPEISLAHGSEYKVPISRARAMAVPCVLAELAATWAIVG